MILAHSLRRAASAEAGLRDDETRRREGANFVIGQSRQLGKLLQLSNPVGVRLREALVRTKWAERCSHKLFERLLMVDLPELES